MDTLLLDVDSWDLQVDGNGNIAMATGAYALAQDAASACRLFLGELWFDTQQGVSYWQEILGFYPPASLVTAQLEAAALTVPGVASASVTITGFNQRTVSGTVTITSTTGQTATANV